MKTWKLAVAILALSLTALAQTTRYDNYAWTTQFVNGVSVVKAVTNAQINICPKGTLALPCSAVSVYSDQSGNSIYLLAQPLLSDASGAFGFWVFPGTYTYFVTIGGLTTGPYPLSIAPGLDVILGANTYTGNQTAPYYLAKDIYNSQNTTVEAFGDSFTAGFGLSSPTTQNWAAQYAVAKGLTLTNHALSGSMCADQADFFLAATPGTSSQYLWMIGYNDMRVHGTNATQLLETKACILAGISWLSIPSSQMVTAQNAACVATGSWVSLVGYGGTIGKSGTSNSSNMTCTTPPGTTVILYTLTQANNNATFSVSIDGATQINQSPAGSGTTFSDLGTTTTYLNSRTYAPAAYRFVGLSNQPHTVTITGISADGVTNNIQILGVAAVSQSTSTNLGPAVLVATIPRDNAAGYAVTCSPVNCNNGSDAAAGLYSLATAEVVYGLAQDGLRVSLFDVTSSRVFDPAVGAGLIQADNIHPNLAGQTSLANAALSATNSINNRRTPTLLDRPVLRGGICGLNSTACQQQRVATCSTSTTQFNTCPTSITWPSAFQDTNYTVNCFLDNPNQAGIIGWTNTKTASSIVAVTVNLGSGTAVTTGTVNCTAVHQQ